MSKMSTSWAHLRKLWRFILIILTPLVLLPVIFLDGIENAELKVNKITNRKTYEPFHLCLAYLSNYNS